MIIADIFNYLTIIFGIIIVYFGITLYKQIKGGALAKVVLYTTLSSLFFGSHHLLRIILKNVSQVFVISELVESVAAILLLVAAYNLYKLSGELFTVK